MFFSFYHYALLLLLKAGTEFKLKFKVHVNKSFQSNRRGNKTPVSPSSSAERRGTRKKVHRQPPQQAAHLK